MSRREKLDVNALFVVKCLPTHLHRMNDNGKYLSVSQCVEANRLLPLAIGKAAKMLDTSRWSFSRERRRKLFPTMTPGRDLGKGTVALFARVSPMRPCAPNDLRQACRDWLT